MKKKDQDNSPKKSISNLEDQSINADKVQGGLKISYERQIRERDGFTDTITGDETPTSNVRRKNPSQNRTNDLK